MRLWFGPCTRSPRWHSRRCTLRSSSLATVFTTMADAITTAIRSVRLLGWAVTPRATIPWQRDSRLLNSRRRSLPRGTSTSNRTGRTSQPRSPQSTTAWAAKCSGCSRKGMPPRIRLRRLATASSPPPRAANCRSLANLLSSTRPAAHRGMTLTLGEPLRARIPLRTLRMPIPGTAHRAT